VCSVSVGGAFVGNDELPQRIQTTTMSETAETTQEKSMSKNLQVVAYLDVSHDTEERQVMQAIDDTRDYSESETNVSDHYRAVFAGGEMRIDSDQYEHLSKHDPDGMRLIHYTEESETYKYGSYRFKRSMLNDCLSDVDMVMPDSDMRSTFGRRVKRDGDTIFKASSKDFKRMRELKHPTEVEEGDMFKDDDTEYWAVVFQCDVKGLKPSTYRWFDNRVIPAIIKSIYSHDAVRFASMLDCEKEYSESGVCFNL